MVLTVDNNQWLLIEFQNQILYKMIKLFHYSFEHVFNKKMRRKVRNEILLIHTNKYYQNLLHLHKFLTNVQALIYLIGKKENDLKKNINKNYLNQVHDILQEHLMSLCIVDDDYLIDQYDNIQHQQQYHYNKLK